jgi:hypothetical protein
MTIIDRLSSDSTELQAFVPPIQRRRDLIIITVIGLVVNGCLGLGILLRNPDYLRNYELGPNPDAIHYALLGHNFWSKGVYSRQATPPYEPDVLRTPIYPVLVGAITMAGAVTWPLYAMQVVFALATNALVYMIALRCWRGSGALCGGILSASSVSLAVLNFEAMSESLFTLLSTASALLWVRTLLDERQECSWLLQHALLGMLLGIAILTRPAAMYLPLVMGAATAVCVVFARAPRSARKGMCAALLLIAVSYSLVAPWVVRNYIVFGVPRVTTADTINLVYFAGAGAYQVEHGISGEEARERISQEFGLVSLVKTNNHWLADQAVAEIDAAQRRAVPRILMQYPRSLVLATVCGLGKAAISHNVGGVAYLWRLEWKPPGMGTVFTEGPRAFVDRARQNTGVLLGIFAWEMMLMATTYALAGIGVGVALRRRPWRYRAACLMLLSAYYCATIAVVGIDAYMRHRAMIIPLVCVFGGLGFSALRANCWARKGPQTPPEAASPSPSWSQ